MSLDFNTAKDQVANEWKRPLDWILDGSNGYVDMFYAAVSEKMAKSWANEAVEADRTTIRATCLSSMPKLNKSGYIEGYYWFFDGQAFQELPLPFPQQPDGI